MSPPDRLPAGPAAPVSALQLRQQSYQLQTGLAHSEAADETDDSISVKDMLRIVGKHKWLLLGAMSLCTAAALMYGLTTTPVYQATVLLQIDRSSARIVQFNKDVDASQGEDSLMLQTNNELLRSRTLAERVIDDLQLDPTRGQVQTAGVAPGASVNKPARTGSSEAAAPQEGWLNSIVAGYRRVGKPSVNDREYLSREGVVARFMKSSHG